MRNLYIAYTKLFFFALLLLVAASCKEEDDEASKPRPEPFIELENQALEVRQGNAFSVDIDIEAQGGLASLVISKDGNAFREEDFVSGQVATTYALADTLDGSATVGSTIVYTIRLIDRLDRAVESQLTVSVEASQPSIAVVSEETSSTVAAGEGTRILLAIDAGVGLSSLTVSRDGAVIDQQNYSGDTRILYQVKDTIDASTTVNGTIFNYQFLAVDANGNELVFDFPVTFLETLFKLESFDTLGVEMIRITGNFNIDTVLTADKLYLLQGIVQVVDGAALSIEAGTKIYASPTIPSALVVAQGATLMAEGTSESPIVMTSLYDFTGSPSAGDWAGLFVNGNAAANGIDGTLAAITGPYSGGDDDDNSGVIRYVVVAYAGQSLDGRGGGISFNAVGSGTEVDYIQAYRCANDGIRFRGGAVNIRHLVSEENNARGIRIQDGYTGLGQYWVVSNNNRSSDASAFVSRNSDEVFGTDDPILEPRSNPIISNITLTHDQSGEVIGLRLRRQSIGQFYNGIATGFTDDGGIETDNNLEDEISDGSIIVKSFHAFNNEPANFGGPSSAFLADASFLSSESAISITGYVGSATANATDPSQIDSWFEGAQFIGAVESSNDWTLGWSK